MTATTTDRIVTFRATAPVAITLDLSRAPADRLVEVPEEEWPTFLAAFLRDAVHTAFRNATARKNGEEPAVVLSTGPDDYWSMSDIVADVDRATGEVILPPEVAAEHALVSEVVRLLGLTPEELDAALADPEHPDAA